MARPIKDNAEYFPHVVQMRNDEKIKALRRRFKLQGYAIYNMLIEYMAGKDHFKFEYNEFTLELIAGDFDADVKEIQEIISYCLTLKLFQSEDGYIRCLTLEKKLEPLLSKRKYNRDRVTVTVTPPEEDSCDKSAQSKVKKSKEKDSKENPVPLFDSWKNGEEAFKEIQANETFVEQMVRIARASGYLTYTDVQVMKGVRHFITLEEAKPDFDRRPRDDIKKHLINWINTHAKKLADYG